MWWIYYLIMIACLAGIVIFGLAGRSALEDRKFTDCTLVRKRRKLLTLAIFLCVISGLLGLLSVTGMVIPRKVTDFIGVEIAPVSRESTEEKVTSEATRQAPFTDDDVGTGATPTATALAPEPTATPSPANAYSLFRSREETGGLPPIVAGKTGEESGTEKSEPGKSQASVTGGTATFSAKAVKIRRNSAVIEIAYTGETKLDAIAVQTHGPREGETQWQFEPAPGDEIELNKLEPGASYTVILKGMRQGQIIGQTMVSFKTEGSVHQAGVREKMEVKKVDLTTSPLFKILAFAAFLGCVALAASLFKQGIDWPRWGLIGLGGGLGLLPWFIFPVWLLWIAILGDVGIFIFGFLRNRNGDPLTSRVRRDVPTPGSAWAPDRPRSRRRVPPP